MFNLVPIRDATDDTRLRRTNELSILETEMAGQAVSRFLQQGRKLMPRRTFVVGSSPQLLLDALRLRAEGDNVTIFEKKADLGGAWATSSFAGYNSVETGCHLLERDPRIYAFLEEQGLALDPMEPVPQVIVRAGWSVPYTSWLPHVILLAGWPISSARRLKLAVQSWRTGELPLALRASGRRALFHASRAVEGLHDRAPILWFRGGAGGAIRTLEQRLLSDGIEIRRGQAITGIDVCMGHERARLTIDNEEVQEADLVVASSALDPTILQVNGHSIYAHDRESYHVHLLLSLEPGSALPFSYVQFTFEPVLLRCSNVTSSAYRTAPGPERELILVHLRGNRDPATWPAVDQVVERLKVHRLLNEHAKLYEHQWHGITSRDSYTLVVKAIRRLRLSNLRVHRTYGDLVPALSRSDIVYASGIVNAARLQAQKTTT